MKIKSQLKLLLLQIRDKPQVREEEFNSFVSFSGLSENQLDILNVFDTPSFEPNQIDEYDALIIGGASEASVLEPETYTFLEDSYRMVRYALEINKPVFASCFGFQVAVVAMGGEIVRDEHDFEIGTVAIDLTDAAKEDPLMSKMPNPFLAVSVHRERAPTLPEQCKMLAESPACPHVFKVKEKPFWAFQFHPEVDKKILIERLTVFREQYTKDAEHLDYVLTHAVETPESNALVRYFVEYLCE